MIANPRLNNAVVKESCILRILLTERKDQFQFYEKGVFQDSSFLSSHNFWVVSDNERDLMLGLVQP